MTNPFGVLAFLHWNHDWNNYHFNAHVLRRALHQLQELQVGFIRMDILWSDVHRGPFRYDFSRYDELIDRVRDHGLHILAVLQYNKVDRVNGCEVWNIPPADFYEFSAYVRTTVARYKQHIGHWEIWNEPNMALYWAGPKDGLKSYSRLLQLSAAEAKKEDPNCRILNGGLTEPILTDVENLYRHGALECADVLNIHTFLNPHDPRSPEAFHRLINGVSLLMDRRGDTSKKIWITEMGCPGVPQGKGATPWFAGPHVDEATQARWLDLQYQLIKSHPRVEKLFWAFYRDTDNEFKDGTDYLGLVKSDLSPKPAFQRFKKIIQELESREEKS